MKRTQIYLDEVQDARLSQHATASGTTKSALIRMAIDAYLSGPATAQLALARFRVALAQVEAQPVCLPDGADYVGELRRQDLVRQAQIEDRLRP